MLSGVILKCPPNTGLLYISIRLQYIVKEFAEEVWSLLEGQISSNYSPDKTVIMGCTGRQLTFPKASREIIVYHPYDCVSVWLTLLQLKTIYTDVESCLLIANP